MVRVRVRVDLDLIKQSLVIIYIAVQSFNRLNCIRRNLRLGLRSRFVGFTVRVRVRLRLKG